MWLIVENKNEAKLPNKKNIVNPVTHRVSM